MQWRETQLGLPCLCIALLGTGLCPVLTTQHGPYDMLLVPFKCNSIAETDSSDCIGDTVPLDTFVDFAQGSDVVIHESVGPVWNFSTAGVAGINILLVCHGFILQRYA